MTSLRIGKHRIAKKSEHRPPQAYGGAENFFAWEGFYWLSLFWVGPLSHLLGAIHPWAWWSEPNNNMGKQV